MDELPDVTPDYFQILVVRELRKVGFEVGEVRVHRRSELPEPQRGFVVELRAPLGHAGWHKLALIACRRQDDPVGPEIVHDLRARLPNARAEVGMLVATADYDAKTVAAAHLAGVGLLHVIDGRKTYDRSGYGTGGHYPSWLPRHTVEMVDADDAGQLRARALEAGGGAAVVLAALETAQGG